MTLNRELPKPIHPLWKFPLGLLFERIPKLLCKSIVYLVLSREDLCLVLFHDLCSRIDLCRHVGRSVVLECRVANIPGDSRCTVFDVKSSESTLEVAIDIALDEIVR